MYCPERKRAAASIVPCASDAVSEQRTTWRLLDVPRNVHNACSVPKLWVRATFDSLSVKTNSSPTLKLCDLSTSRNVTLLTVGGNRLVSLRVNRAGVVRVAALPRG